MLLFQCLNAVAAGGDLGHLQPGPPKKEVFKLGFEEKSVPKST